jgi:hypothetical protein
MKLSRLGGILLLLLFASATFAQKSGIVRGNVFDSSSGEPIIYGTVILEGTDFGMNTNLEGFFSFTDVPSGTYNLIITYVGFETYQEEIKIEDSKILYKNIEINPSSVQLSTFNISGRKSKARTEVTVSQLSVSASELKALPAAGDPDIAQYLPVLPGVISTGDQGGQIYIRGGAPIQNLMLLDGVPIINPFHSIGFFSVFETETIKSVDVLTGGFGAKYGGRLSAVVDIKTRDGNTKNLSGKISTNPFMTKALIEGPLKKAKDPKDGSVSFMLTGKTSYIDQTSRTLYPYAVAVGGGADQDNLPYSFTDLYGKLTLKAGNGSKLNLFAFDYNDRVNYEVANLNWNLSGFGAKGLIIPTNSNLIISSNVAYSSYNIDLVEDEGYDRTSGIQQATVNFDFSYYGLNTDVNYGLFFNTLRTDFKFRNFRGITIDQVSNAAEMGGYFSMKSTFGGLILEPSVRGHFYQAQSAFSIEPRLGAKYNVSDNFRLKMAGGIYSQNLLSSVNEEEVVNIFVGFLLGPEEEILDVETGGIAESRLQRASHLVLGTEFDLTDNLELNVEAYTKQFGQLVSLNRNKTEASTPDFVAENGEARGLDFSLRYEKDNFYVWSTYSLGKVTRFDGEQVFPTIFDRRHNVNLLFSYKFGANNSWESGVRWNYGSELPFTQTQGFYGNINFLDQGLDTNVGTTNPALGTLYSSVRNGGRLTPYHRLDLSVKRIFKINKRNTIEAQLSFTNAYNRRNIFFIDRKTSERIDQLPILPNFTLSWSF